MDRLVTSFLILFFITNGAYSGDIQQSDTFDYHQYYRDTLNKPGAHTVQENDLIRVEVKNENSIYFFTKSHHPAHPSLIIRKILMIDGEESVETHGYTAGDEAIFNSWVLEFAESDLQITKYLKNKNYK